MTNKPDRPDPTDGTHSPGRAGLQHSAAPHAPDKPGKPDTSAGNSDHPAPKWRRRSEARPDEVLDAALDLFLAHGFAATRVEDIARRAGISKGAVYLYFPSKAAIVEALVRRAIVPVAANVAAVAGDAKGDPREAIKTMVRMIASRLGDPRIAIVPRLVIAESGNFPELAATYRAEVLEPVSAALVGLVARGIAEGALRPVEPELALRSIAGPLVAHLLLAAVFGLTPKGGLDMAAFVEIHLDILMNGLARRPGEG